MKATKWLKLTTSITLVLLVLVLALSGCAKPAAPTTPAATTPAATTPAATKPAATTPTTIVPTTPAATKPAPTPAAAVIEWRAVDHLTRGTVRSLINEEYCKKMELLSGGRLKFKYYANNELMSTAELGDAIINGVVEWYHSYGPYFAGKIGKLCTLESGMGSYVSIEGQWVTFVQGGLIDILRKAYAEQKMYYIMPVSLYPVGGDYLYSRIPLAKASDLKGKKVRSSGISAEILTKAGASTAYFPWEELYLALQTGTVDAAEMASMSEMYALGLAEVAKHWYLPAWIISGTCNYVTNLNAWNKLPDDLKALVETASWAVNVSHGGNAWLLDYQLIPTIQKAGVTIHYWTAEDMAFFKAAWLQVLIALGNSGDKYCKEFFDKGKAIRQKIGEWPE